MTLPPGYYLHRDTRCPVCHRPVVEVDRIEGLPVYMCPDRCGQADEAGEVPQPDPPGPEEAPP